MALRRYPLVALIVFALLLLLFLVVEVWRLPLLTDPTPWLRPAGVSAALVGMGLLLADALLPIPSSLVMIAHGAAFGAGIGALLSVVGGAGATMIGCWRKPSLSWPAPPRSAGGERCWRRSSGRFQSP